MMFAVLAEDRSDADTLAELVKRICGEPNALVKKKGFGGCGELCRKAGSHIADFAKQGITRFIICHDADGKNPEEIRQKVRDAIGAKIDLKMYTHRIIVPIQEIEAWIIADEDAITKVIPTLSISSERRPEAIKSPKEWLVRASRRGKSKPLYSPVTFNHVVARHLDIDKVSRKCVSFDELVSFVRS